MITFQTIETAALCAKPLYKNRVEVFLIRILAQNCLHETFTHILQIKSFIVNVLTSWWDRNEISKDNPLVLGSGFSMDQQ